MRGLVPAHVEVLPAGLVDAEVITLIVHADIVGPEVDRVSAVPAAGLEAELFEEHAARHLAVLVHLLPAVGGRRREPERIARGPAVTVARLLDPDVGAGLDGAVRS